MIPRNLVILLALVAPAWGLLRSDLIVSESPLGRGNVVFAGRAVSPWNATEGGFHLDPGSFFILTHYITLARELRHGKASLYQAYNITVLDANAAIMTTQASQSFGTARVDTSSVVRFTTRCRRPGAATSSVVMDLYPHGIYRPIHLRYSRSCVQPPLCAGLAYADTVSAFMRNGTMRYTTNTPMLTHTRGAIRVYVWLEHPYALHAQKVDVRAISSHPGLASVRVRGTSGGWVTAVAARATPPVTASFTVEYTCLDKGSVDILLTVDGGWGTSVPREAWALTCTGRAQSHDRYLWWIAVVGLFLTMGVGAYRALRHPAATPRPHRRVHMPLESTQLSSSDEEEENEDDALGDAETDSIVRLRAISDSPSYGT